jgi:hypothetical protein
MTANPQPKPFFAAPSTMNPKLACDTRHNQHFAAQRTMPLTIPALPPTINTAKATQLNLWGFRVVMLGIET